MKQSFIIFAGIIILSACTGSVNQAKVADNISAEDVSSQKIPSLNLNDVNGNPLNLTDFKGKKVFVNMWASWCPPCRAEMPSIQKLYEKTKDKNVQFVMVALDEDFNKSLAFMRTSAPLLPVFHPTGNLPAPLNVQAIPATFIFDEEGKLIKEVKGASNYNADEYVQLLSR